MTGVRVPYPTPYPILAEVNWREIATALYDDADDNPTSESEPGQAAGRLVRVNLATDLVALVSLGRLCHLSAKV